jgi:hypothetical protein
VAAPAGADTADELEALWARTGGDQPLAGQRSFQDYVERLPDWSRCTEVLVGAPTYLLCIDDRLPGCPTLSAAANYVHMAGEGILNPQALPDLVTLRRSRGLAGIITHRDCGAKAAYARGQALVGPTADDAALPAVYALADAARLPVAQMIGTPELGERHPARAVYYDGTGRFDWSKVPGLLPGFIVSRAILSDVGYAQDEVRLALAVALGERGFGHKFTRRTPLYLVAVAPTPDELARLVAELQPVIAGQPAVALETLTVPDSSR